MSVDRGSDDGPLVLWRCSRRFSSGWREEEPAVPCDGCESREFVPLSGAREISRQEGAEDGPLVLVAVTQSPGLPPVMHACVRLDDYEAMKEERDEARRQAEGYRDRLNAVQPLASGSPDYLSWEQR